MLTLQRASAGSGKTYTLTKNFIRLLISISDGESAARLRSDAELRDSIPHILAVTFTNKATDEMKRRILSRLNDLAYNIDYSNLAATDYLLDFMEEFNASAEEISRLCKIALREILYSFSDFNVLTIDSFFQSILRTFAYESDLPDGYELIVDANFITRRIVLDMIDDMQAGKIDKETRKWIMKFIDDDVKRGSRKWNVFNREESTGSYSKGLFNTFCEIAQEFDKESNKDSKASLKEFFEKGGVLSDAYAKLCEYYEDSLVDKFAEVNDYAQKVLTEAAATSDRDLSEYIAGGKNFAVQLRRMASTSWAPGSEIKWSGKTEEWTLFNFTKSGLKKGELMELQERAAGLIKALNDLYPKYLIWMGWLNSLDFKIWQKLKEGFPRVGLLGYLQEHTEIYLNDNSTMKLSDTNVMLKRIISEEEVPFIYERFGTRFHHFLIDEFQDTSRLQWENFLPLLKESESRNNENLIIGDAKQSIYRFRSAEPKLITNDVPATFPALNLRGYSVEENTNYRSSRRIVEFNNFFFRNLTEELGPRLATLYANTVQYPKKREEEGYVEVNYYSADKSAEESIEDKMLPVALLKKISEKIDELLDRGFMQRDIAILTDRRATAREIISYLSDLNSTRGNGKAPLEFVSEDSLTLGSSKAVEMVVHCLRMIQNGMEGRFSDENASDSNSYSSRINWLDIAAHFRYYSLSHPDDSLQDRIENFLAGDFDGEAISLLIAGMQAVTLPSLVEALAEAFVPLDMLRSNALYLAAFQDAVLDYSEIYPSDIASFLRWWDYGGKNTSIISPEGTEAISVMTIHKSKGLEFECVILPDFNFSLELSNEWCWVDVPQSWPHPAALPEKMPIRLTDTRDDASFWQSSPFANVQSEAVNLNLADQLNKAYVAMTRAVEELYIYLPQSNSGDDLKSIGGAFRKIFNNYEDYEIASDPSEKNMLIDSTLLLVDAELGITYGERTPDVASTLKKRREAKGASAEEIAIQQYFINSDRPLLQYHEAGMPAYIDPADDDRIDPRSEGSVLHAVLENVIESSDLRAAFEKVRVRGLITREEIEHYYSLLENAIESVADRGWFDGSMRVMTERPLLKKGEIMRRPDRVMADSSGRLIVIDYKFGSSNKKPMHIRQVSNYMKKLKEYSDCNEIEGYVWYIAEDKIEEIKR